MDILKLNRLFNDLFVNRQLLVLYKCKNLALAA
jgi:adenine-specific DNA methylase